MVNLYLARLVVLVSLPVAHPVASLLDNQHLGQVLAVPPPGVFLVARLLAMLAPSPLAQAVPTQPAALAQGYLDKAQLQHLVRALHLGKDLCLAVTPPHHPLRSALGSPQVSSILPERFVVTVFPINNK